MANAEVFFFEGFEYERGFGVLWRGRQRVVWEREGVGGKEGERAEMEKRNKIAQTQVLDLKIAQKTRNLRHIIIHAKTA